MINLVISCYRVALKMLLFIFMLMRLPFVVMYYIYIFPPYYLYSKYFQLCQLVLYIFCKKSKKIRIFFDHCIAIVQIMEGLGIKLYHADYNEVLSFMSVTITEVMIIIMLHLIEYTHYCNTCTTLCLINYCRYSKRYCSEHQQLPRIILNRCMPTSRTRCFPYKPSKRPSPPMRSLNFSITRN